MSQQKFFSKLRVVVERNPRLGFNMMLVIALGAPMIVYDILDTFLLSLVDGLSARQLLVHYSILLLAFINFFCYYPDENTESSTLDSNL